jgi:hypothetical protein
MNAERQLQTKMSFHPIYATALIVFLLNLLDLSNSHYLDPHSKAFFVEPNGEGVESVTIKRSDGSNVRP